VTHKEKAAPAGTGNGAMNSKEYNLEYITDLTTMARRLGGEVVGRDSILVPGPGHTDDDRSLSVKFVATAPEGFLTTSFAGDGFAACRALVRDALGGREITFAPAPPKNPDAWKRIWVATHDARDTPVEAYLRKRRVSLPPGSDIRYVPRLFYKPENRYMPGMVSLYRNVLTGEPQGVHRTFLNADLTRHDKLCYCPVQYAAVMFGELKPGSTLGIAEGIETALSIRAMGWPDPVWACLSGGNMGNFPVLPGVRNLIIFADRDGEPHFTGEDAARKCAERWRALGRNVEIRLPKEVGDWNDVLMGSVTR
jgi:putative DNA primase/helicase